MARDELDFDYAALENPSFKEDSVREDIIAPILRKAGYHATGSQRMERSQPLVHPFVMIGSKRYKIHIVPDYMLYEESMPLMIIEAKAPNEPILQSAHVEQAYSYAIHPDVRCMHYALCNGRQFAFYHVQTPTPLFVIDCKDIPSRWAEFEKYLLPRYLKLPELRDFLADFGTQAKQLGVVYGQELSFDGYLIQLILKASESLYVANATCNVGGLECLVTFDFGQDVMDLIVRSLPMPQAEQVRSSLTRSPFRIDTDAKVKVHWKAYLGKATKGLHDEFIPMIVTHVVKVEYDPSQTVGAQDPEAVRNGVPRLRG